MNDPRISIIIPVYKAEAFIEKCATSLFEQTFEDLEFIFVDDCSPDNSIQVLKDTIARYPHRQDYVIILRQEHNNGQAAARNRGISAAHGEYIAFVDSDDWVSPLIYETLYNNAISEHAFISCCGIERKLNEKHVSYFNENVDEYFVFSTKEAIESLLDNKKITCSPCDKIFHHSIVKRLPMQEGIIFEDFEVMPRWIHKAKRIVYTGEPLYFYRTNPQSTMTTVSGKRLNEVVASQMRLDFFRENYPYLLPLIEARHIEICLNVLSCTTRAENCRSEREILRNHILHDVNTNIFFKIKLYTKIKLLLLAAGLKVFDCVAKLR